MATIWRLGGGSGGVGLPSSWSYKGINNDNSSNNSISPRGEVKILPHDYPMGGQNLLAFEF